MPFSVPTFNLLANIWNAGHTPAGDLPDRVDQPCQLYLPSRAVPVWDQGLDNPWNFVIILRYPSGLPELARGDIVGLTPAPDYYLVRWSQRIHQGFLNEYRESYVTQCDANGTSPRP
jgi:hypothetical protein